MPANIGELTLTLDSELDKHRQIFVSNVLILGQNTTLAAFFPSNYFTYQQPGVMIADRLGGVICPTPAPGQQKLYVPVFIIEKDLQQTTTLLSPTKTYAKGADNAAPDTPDPIAKYITGGVLKLRVKTNGTSSVLVGSSFDSSGPGSVTVGNTVVPVAVPAAAAAVAPVARNEPMLSDIKTHFNNGIKQAVKQGDIDKALKLMNETERLGSKSVRSTFISSVKGKG